MVILFVEDVAVAPSFGDGGCLVESAADASSCQEKKMMDDKISPIEGQLQYLLNKADEIQVELVWRCDNRILFFVLRYIQAYQMTSFSCHNCIVAFMHLMDTSKATKCIKSNVFLNMCMFTYCFIVKRLLLFDKNYVRFCILWLL